MKTNQNAPTRYCPDCGKPVELGSIFFTSCGTRLDVSDGAKDTMRSQRVVGSNTSRNSAKNHSGSTTGTNKPKMTTWLVSIIFIAVIGAVIIASRPNNLLLTLLQTETSQIQENKIIWSFLFNPINIATDFEYDIHKFFSDNNAFYPTQSDNYYYYYPTGYGIDTDSVYFPSELTNIVFVDLQSGNMNWRSELQGFVLGIGEDTVFVLTSDDRIYGLDKKTGSEKWKIYLKLLVEADDNYSLYPQVIQLSESYYLPVVTDCPNGPSLRFLKIEENSGQSGYTQCNAEADESLVPLVVLGDEIFAADRSFYNLNIEDGSVNWIVRSPRDISYSLADLNVLDFDIEKGTLYYFTGWSPLEDIYAIDIHTGNPIWSEGLIKGNNIKTGYLDGDLYSVDRFIILDSDLGIIYIFDKESGLLINQILAERKHEIYTAENGFIINYYDLGIKFGIDYVSGVELWKDDKTEPYKSSQVGRQFMCFQDVLFLPDEDRNLVAIDQKTGEELWVMDINLNEEFGFHNGELVYFNRETLERVNIQNGTATSINLNGLGSANYRQGHIRIINDNLWMICGRNIIMLNMQ